MLQAKVNEKHQFEVESADEGLKINGKLLAPDILTLDGERIHLLLDQKSYTAELLSISENGKELTIRINNKTHQISLKDKNDILLEKLGMSSSSQRKSNDVKAPMPGLILRLMAEAGKEVKKDEGLLVLEAMKMENVIKAPHEGVLKEIKVQPGDKVEKNQVLVVFE